MRIVDTAGNPLEKGSSAVFPMALGQGVVGTIVEVESGLGIAGPAAIPKIALMFILPLKVEANGVVAGVFAVPSQAPPLAA